MPSLTSITVNDRESTPVAHTFVPDTLSQGVATLVESDGVPIGDNRITMSVRRTASKRKVRVTLALPTTVDETINGVVVPKVTRVAYANLELSFDASSTTQERANTVGMLEGLLGSGQAFSNAVLVNLEGIYDG